MDRWQVYDDTTSFFPGSAMWQYGKSSLVYNLSTDGRIATDKCSKSLGIKA